MNFAAKFFRFINSVFFFVLGGVLFLFILLYIVFSVFVRFFNRLLKLPGLYHFREREFPLLDVSEARETGEYHLLLLGTLPQQQMETQTYFLSPDLLTSAKELLLRASMTTRPGAANYEFEYNIYESGAEQQKQYIYLFVSPFSDMPDISYTESTFWFPVPASRKLEVRFTNVHPNETDAVVKSELDIIRWR